MSNRDAYQEEQFEKAGVQAGLLLGRFMSMASDFATEMGRHTEQNVGNPDPDRHEDHSEILRETGEQLKKIREAAGFTLDRFAETLQKELNQPDINRAEVYGRVDAAESGSEALPGDWVKQVSLLLSSSDSTHFFERLQQCYENKSGSRAAANDEIKKPTKNALLQRRAERLAEIFADDNDLTACSEEDFEKLLSFVEKNYQQAKSLLINPGVA